MVHTSDTDEFRDGLKIVATPKQTDPQFKLRLTQELKRQIEAASLASNRSMNAEIVARLEDSFSYWPIRDTRQKAGQAQASKQIEQTTRLNAHFIDQNMELKLELEQSRERIEKKLDELLARKDG